MQNDDLNAPKIEENVLDSKSSRSSSSGYDYPLDCDVQVEIPKAKAPPFIPKLNFGGKIQLKGGPFEKLNPIEQTNFVVQPKIPTLGLNLENIKKKDFHEEFMEKFDEYSESWREMMVKQQRF